MFQDTYLFPTYMDEEIIIRIYNYIPGLFELMDKPMRVDYDKETDTLYLSFRNSMESTYIVPLTDHILKIEKNGETIGFKVLHVSQLTHHLD